MPLVCILSSVHPALDNRVFFREARSLKNAGYKVKLFAIYPRNEIREGIHIKGLPRLSRWLRPAFWLYLLVKAIQCRADIYLIHDPELLLIVPFIRLFTSKPVIYDVHESYKDSMREKFYIPRPLRTSITLIFSFLERLTVGYISGLLFADYRIASEYEDFNVSKATLFNYPLRTFVDSGTLHARNKRFSNNEIVHVGSHTVIRGTDVMIEAFREVIKTIPDAHLTLVGQFSPPDYRRQIEEQLNSFGIEDSVTITGRVQFDQITDYLRRADIGWIALQPIVKFQKNIPTKVFEYMSYSLAIVSSDVASVRPYITNGENGYLVDASDPKSHAQAIVNLLQNPSEIRRMGDLNAKLVSERYTWDSEEEKLLDLLHDLLDAPSS